MPSPSKPKRKPTHGVKGSASSIAARQKMAASTALRTRRKAAGYDPRVGKPGSGAPSKPKQPVNPFKGGVLPFNPFDSPLVKKRSK